MQKKTLMEQHFVVRECFSEIHMKDKTLDLEAFLVRVQSSIEKNGIERTCENYDLSNLVVQYIKAYQ